MSEGSTFKEAIALIIQADPQTFLEEVAKAEQEGFKVERFSTVGVGRYTVMLMAFMRRRKRG